MRQLTYIRPGVMEWWDVPKPRLHGTDEAIVRPVATANCDLDQLIVRGETPFQGPLALGHEFCAEVEEVGDDVASVTPGDLVVVPFEISCGECDRCRRGLTANCLTVGPRSMYGFGAIGGDWGGALSDLVRVPFADHMLVRLPSGVAPDAVPAASDNLSDAWRTVAPHLVERPAAAVLLIAESPSPLYAVEIALALGSARVDFVDKDERRLEVARSLGANPVHVNEWPRDFGSYPITANGTGDRAALLSAIRSTEPGGICLNAFPFFNDVDPPIPLLEMYVTGISLATGRPHVRICIPKVLDLVLEGQIHPERITGAVVSWEEAPEALLGERMKFVMMPRERAN